MMLPFENDTRKIIKRLAKRSVEHDKRRNFFIISTITLAVCLMGTLCFVYSAQQLQTLENIQGQYQAGCSGMTYEAIERLAAAGKFDKWGYAIDANVIRYNDSTLNVSFVDLGMIDLMAYGEITGVYPQKVNEICVERAFLEYDKQPADIGQTIILDLGNGEREYTITAILEKENNSRIFTCWISESAVLAKGNAAPYELRFRFAGSQISDTEQLRRDIDEFFVEMGIPEDKTFYSSNYFDFANLYLGDGLEIYILAILIALACAVVIYNIFYISVMGKMREYGRLKILGATPKQLKSVVKRERYFLTMIAIPLGLFIAALISIMVAPNYWSWSNNIKYMVMIAFLTYMVILLATKKPLELVGKVSTIEAIRITAYSSQEGIGVSKRLHRRLSIMRLALMNFSRSRKKAAVTALSLSLTGILLICISAYANSVDVKEMALAHLGDRSHYLLCYDEEYFGQDFIDIQQNNPLNEALLEQLAAISGVDYLTAYCGASVEIPEIGEQEPFNVRGLTEEQMVGMYTEENILSGFVDYQQLLEQDGVLVCTAGDTLEAVYQANYEVGDTVTFVCYNGQMKTYTVQGIVKNVTIGSSSQFFILPVEELGILYPEITNFTLYINIHVQQDSEQLRQAIFAAVTDNRITIVTLDDLMADLAVGLQQEMTRLYGILCLFFHSSTLLIR